MSRPWKSMVVERKQGATFGPRRTPRVRRWGWRRWLPALALNAIFALALLRLGQGLYA